jgi:hypothetical protein
VVPRLPVDPAAEGSFERFAQRDRNEVLEQPRHVDQEPIHRDRTRPMLDRGRPEHQKRKDIAAHGTYRTKDKILEIYDAMTQAKSPGTDYQTLVTPPPGEGPRHPARELFRRIPWQRGASCLGCSPKFFLLGPAFAAGDISREGSDSLSNVIVIGEFPLA